MASDPRSEADAQAAGFTRRFVADEPRLSEGIANYRELGFEVVTVPVSPEAADCSACMVSSPDRYQVIYTRPAAANNE